MMKCMQAVEDMNSVRASIYCLGWYNLKFLSLKQEKDDRKELIYVALGRNLCRAVIET